MNTILLPILTESLNFKNEKVIHSSFKFLISNFHIFKLSDLALFSIIKTSFMKNSEYWMIVLTESNRTSGFFQNGDDSNISPV